MLRLSLRAIWGLRLVAPLLAKKIINQLIARYLPIESFLNTQNTGGRNKAFSFPFLSGGG